MRSLLCTIGSSSEHAPAPRCAAAARCVRMMRDSSLRASAWRLRRPRGREAAVAGAWCLLPALLAGCGAIGAGPGNAASSASNSPSATPQTSYAVNLHWDIPDSPSDPIAGYNIYRAPAAASAYQQLNANSLVTEASFTDTTVESGSGYQYVVRSVDSYGMESSPSNSFEVRVP